jgi:glucokinase
MIVLVTGLPGSGKSTLARALRDATGLPLFGLDTVKEAVVDGLGAMPDDRYVVRRAGLTVLARLAEDNPRGCILDVWVDPTFPPIELTQTLWTVPSATFREVVCRVPGETAVARYVDRPRSHISHLPPDEATLGRIRAAAPLIRPVGIGPHLDVDTTTPVEGSRLRAVVEWLAS